MRLFKKTLIILLGVFFLLSSTAFSANDIGEQLVKKLFNDLSNKDMKALNNEIASGFQAVTLGQIQNKVVFMNDDKMSELAALQNVKTVDYTIDGFRTTQEGSVLVVTYWVAAPRKVSNGEIVSLKSMKLLCFVQTAEGWKAVAYAGFMPQKQ